MANEQSLCHRVKGELLFLNFSLSENLVLVENFVLRNAKFGDENIPF